LGPRSPCRRAAGRSTPHGAPPGAAACVQGPAAAGLRLSRGADSCGALLATAGPGRSPRTGLRRSRSAGSWRRCAAAQRCPRAWRQGCAGVRCGAASARSRRWMATCCSRDWREAGHACSACSRCWAALPACMWRAAWQCGRPLAQSAQWPVSSIACACSSARRVGVARLVGGAGWGW